MLIGRLVPVKVVSQPQLKIEGDTATMFVLVQEIKIKNAPARELLLSQTKFPLEGTEMVAEDRSYWDETVEMFLDFFSNRARAKSA